MNTPQIRDIQRGNRIYRGANRILAQPDMRRDDVLNRICLNFEDALLTDAGLRPTDWHQKLSREVIL